MSLKFLSKYSSSINLFLTTVIALATIFNFLLWQNAQQQLEEAKKSSQGSLIVELNKDVFFQDKLYKLRKAIENNQSIFQPNGEFTEQDVDDYIGTFEMMYLLYKREILDFKLMDDNFGGFVEEAWDNKEIKQYILDQRKKSNNQGIYSEFEKWAETPNK